MQTVEIGWRDIEGMRRYRQALDKVGSQYQFMMAGRRAVARTGDMARTQVVRALATQTGLPQKTIRKAIKVTRPNFDAIAYRMRATGGDISLKYFKPRETRRGVTAAPFGKRELFAGTFMKAGAFPGRVAVAKFGGHVFERDGKERLPVVKIKSGVIIPQEMVAGETAKAFERSVSDNLPRRFAHEINRLTGNAFG